MHALQRGGGAGLKYTGLNFAEREGRRRRVRSLDLRDDPRTLIDRNAVFVSATRTISVAPGCRLVCVRFALMRRLEYACALTL